MLGSRRQRQKEGGLSLFEFRIASMVAIRCLLLALILSGLVAANAHSGAPAGLTPNAPALDNPEQGPPGYFPGADPTPAVVGEAGVSGPRLTTTERGAK